MELNIFKIPLYYIAFNRNQSVEDHYKNMGFENVNHFQAIVGKKLDIQALIQNQIISVRSYDDLMSGRSEHSGMTSIGAIGCSLSHCELWKLCVDNNWPYIIIAEEDNRMYGQLQASDIIKIQQTLSKPKSVFISVNIIKKDHRNQFFGSHFYIPSLAACKELIKDFYPIDVQLDWYIAHESTIGNISLEGFPISKQTTPFGKSSIQTKLCFKCILPKNIWFYVAVIALFLIILICIYVYRHKWIVCEKTCSSSREESG